MRGAVGLLVALALGATPARAAEPVTTHSRLSLSGVGAIAIGIEVSAAERRTGQEIRYLSGQVGGPECGSGELIPRRLGVTLLGTSSRVAFVDVSERGIATARGVRVGDSVGKLRAEYPSRLVRTKSFYDPSRANFEYRRGNRKLVFYSDNRKILFMRTGRRPEVDYVEGCA